MNMLCLVDLSVVWILIFGFTSAQEGLGSRNLPFVLSLLPDPFGNGISTILSQHLAIAAHLAPPFGGDHGDLQWALDAIALERFELEGFAAANDVAAIEMTANAMGFKQGSAIGCRMGWGRSDPEPKHQQQAN